MNYFDYAILIFLGIFLLLGFWKGFIKTGLSLISWGVSLALIYFFAEKLGGLIMSTPIGGWVNNGFTSLFGKIGEFGSMTVGVNADGTKYIIETGAALSSALSGMYIPMAMQNAVQGFFVADMTVAGGMAAAMTSYAGMAIAAVVIVIVVSIIVKIISIFLHKALRVAKLGAVNRLLGAVLYVAVGVCVLSAIMLIIDLMSPIGFMKPVIEMRDSGTISSLLVKYNPISLIINAIGKVG